MPKIILTKQFGKECVIDSLDQNTKDLNTFMSLQCLIDFQTSINSVTGYYLFKNNQNHFSFVLSDDQKLANKMKTSINHDIFTVDLFPIDYSTIDIMSVFKHNKDDITSINTNKGNFFYFIAKEQDAVDTLKFIEMYTSRSYSMKKIWKNRKLKSGYHI